MFRACQESVECLSGCVYSRGMAGGYLRIGEFSERVGVSPDLLRAWERRYDLLCPDRSSGGFRLYSDEDVARVERMADHLRRGLSAAQAARFALDPDQQGGPGPAADALSPQDGLEHLDAALHAFDEVAAHDVLDRLLSSLPLETVLRDVVLPYLARVGARWAEGEVTVAQEHFASSILRGRLLALARDWGTGAGPLALLAAPPGEDHDLALLVFGLVLWRRGWRITFLGADTPPDALSDTVARVGPELVVVATVDPAALERAGEELAALSAGVALALGGPGATAAFAERVGARLLGTDPVTAAEELPSPATDEWDRPSARA
jgi:MerR family transcriptional regulator, light-induced transcriptional regulator